MADYITLLGSEDVSRAASRMSEAAGEMRRAVGSLEDTLHRHRLFMDEWLGRLEQILAPTVSDKEAR